MLELDRAAALPVGYPVRIGIAWGPQQAVLRSASFEQATVLRSLTLNGRNHLAVRLESDQKAAATA